MTFPLAELAITRRINFHAKEIPTTARAKAECPIESTQLIVVRRFPVRDLCINRILAFAPSTIVIIG